MSDPGRDTAVAGRGEELLPRLATRRVSWYAKCAMLSRILGLAVVMLTTVIGTSIFVSLGENPHWAAQVAVGTLGILAALAAAWKENAQYGKRSEAHQNAASAFERLRYGTEKLHDKLELGRVSWEVAEKELEEFENAAEKLIISAPTLPDRAITASVAFIKNVHRERSGLAASL